MQRISVHISDETKQRINLAVRAKGKMESEIIRDALEQGLRVIHPKSSSAQALINLAKLAEQLPSEQGAPKNVSENHDYYAWGGEKRRDE